MGCSPNKPMVVISKLQPVVPVKINKEILTKKESIIENLEEINKKKILNIEVVDEVEDEVEVEYEDYNSITKELLEHSKNVQKISDLDITATKPKFKLEHDDIFITNFFSIINTLRESPKEFLDEIQKDFKENYLNDSSNNMTKDFDLDSYFKSINIISNINESLEAFVFCPKCEENAKEFIKDVIVAYKYSDDKFESIFINLCNNLKDINKLFCLEYFFHESKDDSVDKVKESFKKEVIFKRGQVLAILLNRNYNRIGLYTIHIETNRFLTLIICANEEFYEDSKNFSSL